MSPPRCPHGAPQHLPALSNTWAAVALCVGRRGEGRSQWKDRGVPIALVSFPPPPHSIPTSRYGGGTHPSAPPSLHKTPGRTGTKKAEKCIFALPAWPCPPPPPPQPLVWGSRCLGLPYCGDGVDLRASRWLPPMGCWVPGMFAGGGGRDGGDDGGGSESAPV